MTTSEFLQQLDQETKDCIFLNEQVGGIEADKIEAQKIKDEDCIFLQLQAI